MFLLPQPKQMQDSGQVSSQEITNLPQGALQSEQHMTTSIFRINLNKEKVPPKKL